MNLEQKIAALRPNEPFWVEGETVDGIHFVNDGVKPITQAELDKATPQLEYDFAVAQVQAERQAAYVAESDPLFFKYQRAEDGITKAAWLAKVDEIRERYPLPVK